MYYQFHFHKNYASLYHIVYGIIKPGTVASMHTGFLEISLVHTLVCVCVCVCVCVPLIASGII